MAYLYKRGKTYYLGHSVKGQPDHRQSLHTTSWKEAREKQAEFEMNESRRGARTTETPIPDVVAAYLAHVKQTKAPATYEEAVCRLGMMFGPVCPALTKDMTNPQQRGAMNQWAKHTNGDFREHLSAPCFEAITTRDLSDWLRTMTEHRQWGPVTSDKVRKVMSGLWAWALKTHGLRRTGAEVEVSPVEGVQSYSIPAPIISWLNYDQIDQQLAVLAPHPQIQVMAATMIYGGLRRGEVLHLQHGDVDLNRKMLLIHRKDWPGGSWKPKEDRHRTVPINSDLLPYLQRQVETPKIVPNNWLFPSPEGHLWMEDNFSRRLRNLNTAAGLTWTPSDYRHTFASILVQQVESAEHIARVMGNSAEVVRKHYAALLDEELGHMVEFKRPVPASAPPSDAARPRLHA